MMLNMVQGEILHNELLVIHVVYRKAHQMHSNIGYIIPIILVAEMERRVWYIFSSLFMHLKGHSIHFKFRMTRQ